MDITVVILNWNTRELLEKCLRSLVCPMKEYEAEIIVVDNASEDGSREMVIATFPQVRLVVNSNNIGFGAGNNTAIPSATGRYVLFLNSDTVVMNGALEALIWVPWPVTPTVIRLGRFELSASCSGGKRSIH